MSRWKRFLAEEDGQDMVEYGLVISLVVIGAIAAYSAFGTAIGTGINNLTTNISANL